MGTSQVLKLTIPPIVELAKDIVECTHGINKPGMPKYFLSERGQEYLESLEHKNKVMQKQLKKTGCVFCASNQLKQIN